MSVCNSVSEKKVENKTIRIPDAITARSDQLRTRR